MSDTSINARQRYVINGEEVDASNDWQDVTISAEYEKEAIQPHLSIDSFQFSLRAREVILKWVSDGNIFEGLPISVTLFNNQPQENTFEGILDFSEEYTDFIDDGKVDISLKKKNGLDEFFANISGLSFGYLEDIGFINGSDYKSIKYVVQKRYSPLDLVIVGLTIYLLVKEIAESIERTLTSIANVISSIATFPAGPANAIALAIALALINIIYTAVLLVAIINLLDQLFQMLSPPRRTHKVMLLKKMLEKVCAYYGFTFETNVALLDKTFYLPSNTNTDELSLLGFIDRPKGTDKGIPNAQDTGYICSDMFDLAKKLCDGKFSITNKVVTLRSRKDPFWIQTSVYNMPDVLINQKEYNSVDLLGTRVYQFLTDLNDEYTIDNFKGTIAEVKTDLITPVNADNNLIKDFEEVSFGVALGNRKQSLTALEQLLKGLAGVADAMTRVFGKRTNYSSKIKGLIGILKVTDNYNSVAKLLYLEGSTIPSNHRDFLSADAIFNVYYGEDSFVQNNYRGQKAVYRGYRIPFGLEDYKKLTTNSYFVFRGAEAKIINFDWNMDSDFAIVDFWVREVYTRNLKETIIVPT